MRLPNSLFTEELKLQCLSRTQLAQEDVTVNNPRRAALEHFLLPWLRYPFQVAGVHVAVDVSNMRRV